MNLMPKLEPVDEIEGGNRGKMIRGTLTSLFVLIVGILLVTKNMTVITNFIQQNGTLGLIVCVLVYGILGASLVPSEPLTVLISAIFGPWIAILVATFGNMLAAMIEYVIGMKIGDATSFEKQRTKLPFGLGKLPVESPVFLIVGRLTPGYGPKLISVISGVYRVPIKLYLWTTAVPTVLGAAVLAFGGAGLFQLFKP